MNDVKVVPPGKSDMWADAHTFGEGVWSFWFAGPGSLVGTFLSYKLFTEPRGCLSRTEGTSLDVLGQTVTSDGICTVPSSAVGLPTVDNQALEWLISVPLGVLLYASAVVLYVTIKHLRA